MSKLSKKKTLTIIIGIFIMLGTLGSYKIIVSANDTNGWQQNGQTWNYYINGREVTGWKLIKGKWYYFNKNGEMLTDWVQDGSKWYYLTKNGDMTTGWQKVGFFWYYMYADGSMASNTTIGIYKILSNGIWKDPNVETEVPEVGGISYNFNKTQLYGLAVELPITNGPPGGQHTPRDGRLYHHTDSFIDQNGIQVIHHWYYKYLYSTNYSNGVTIYSFLEFTCNNNIIGNWGIISTPEVD